MTTLGQLVVESQREVTMMSAAITVGHHPGMPSRDRPFDRGTRRARAIEAELGAEIRRARTGGNLTQRQVGSAAGITGAYVSLIERGLAHGASIVTLARVTAVVGLDLSVRVYPGATILRDAGHHALLERFRAVISPNLGWRTEVPLPNPGDQRAWDAMIVGDRRATEQGAKTRPRDAQALQRRLALKRRDGGVDHVLLLLAATRGNRAFLRETWPALSADFPLPGRSAVRALAAGRDPGASAIVVI